jgi:endonuclease G
MRKAADYADRAGYDPEFLGIDVPMPALGDSVRAKAVQVTNGAGAASCELKYDHFSVVMNREARLAFVAAVNLDAAAPFRQTREGGDRWFADPRVDREAQAGDEFYTGNPLDRGHLVRRADAAWGRTAAEAERASQDTFHFTNCSPQHEIYNQARKAQKDGLLLWGNIEEYIAAQAATERSRICVFNGPVFRASDRPHRGLRVPREYWKVVVYRRQAQARALGFILSQDALIADLPLEEFTAGPYRPFQVRLTRLEARTRLDFGALVAADTLPAAPGPLEQGVSAVPLASLEEISL